MEMDKETSLIEAILYLESDPLDINTLCRISALEDTIVLSAIENLEARYKKEDSGVEILKIGGGFMLAPKKEHWEALKDHYAKKSEAKLSRAAMETLSIIAYKQPVTRAEIEAIRGVQADNMIRLLQERGLIHEAGKKDIPGKPVQFGTTPEFLQFFHLNSIADLPKLDESEADRFELQS
jgi:segregation and condensation protein B